MTPLTTDQSLGQIRVREDEYLRDSKKYFELSKSQPVVIVSMDGRSVVTARIPNKPLADD